MDATATDVGEPGGIAVIGMACRLPGAPDIASFWRLLCAGQEGLTRFTASELRAAGVPPEVIASSDYVPVNGIIPDAAMFDAGFFGMNPREASITDPQHRIFLELAWQALEASGHEPPGHGEAVGVFAGCGSSTYLLHNLWSNWRDLAELGELRLRLGNGQEYLATRVSYKLNLQGPGVSINTACSTSLVAVHLACDSLLGFQCDMAIAGGISVQVPQVKGYRHEPGGILSPDGRCRAFDADAGGTVSGNGGAVVVLRRLADAIVAGDTIYAVIRGSAINNDGNDKAGYTAPSQSAQRRVIEEAQQVAGIDPVRIGYVEAHGTGTPLGDPIEFAALTEAFRARTDAIQSCALGSLKTNFGHLDEAAGVAGLLKAVLCLHHRQIPPSLHFRRPNPELAYASSPFYVNATLRPWDDPADGAPRFAGVSSFGIGGTNAHVVLQEAQPRRPGPLRRPLQILPLSAPTPQAFERRRDELAAWLAGDPVPMLADVAYTLQTGRRAFAWRDAVVAAEPQDAAACFAAARCRPQPAPPREPPVVFMCSGQGSQYPGMAAALYEAEPVFRDSLDRCIEGFRPHVDADLRRLLLAPDGDAAALRPTAVAQPALFALEFAVAQLWQSWGVRPAALIGHSLGEFVALCLAGVMELETALAIVAQRGRLMQGAPTGAMLAVPLPRSVLERDLDPALDIAAVNAPDRCCVAGPADRVEALAERLRDQDVATTRLRVSHGFHSQAMASAAAALADVVRPQRLRPPRIPILSNVSGDWLTASEATRPDYYAQQMRHAVQFAAGIERVLHDMPDALLLEVGPGSTLVQAARRCGSAACFASLPASHDGLPHRTLLTSFGGLWERGVAVDWAAFADPDRQRVALPTYPFARERHWVDPPPAVPQRAPNQPPVAAIAASSGAAAAPVEAIAEAGWCYRPVWRRVERSEAAPPQGHWLLLAEDAAAAAMEPHLRTVGCRVTRVRGGTAFSQIGDADFAVNPLSSDDFGQVLARLSEPPTQVLWAWSHEPGGRWRAEDWCAGLVALLQALDSAPAGTRLAVLASGLAAVAPGEAAALDPENGTLPGLLRSAALEYPERAIRLLDLPAGGLGDQAAMRAVVQFCGQADGDDFCAWRGGAFWAAAYAPAGPPAQTGLALRHGGTYLITGGLGGIGLSLAEALARDWKARLVLLGRTALPPEHEWMTRLADPATPASLRRRIGTLQALRAAGADVLVCQTDVSDQSALRAAVGEARRRFGPLHGVIHAAGIADGALLARRGTDDIAAVLAPKIGGLRALVAVLRDERLDFCVLCSALSAQTGAPGQAIYCAANSYLDVLAESAAAPWPTLAIGWDAWRDVGMAAAVAGSPLRSRLLRIPGSGNRVGGVAYRVVLSAAADWVLAEHRIGERTVLPGTASLDLVATAFRDFARADGFSLEDVAFVQPIAVSGAGSVELALAFAPQGQHYHFTVSTRSGDTETLHVQGDIADLGAGRAPETHGSDPAEVDGWIAAEPDFTRRLAAFGPHWHGHVAFRAPGRDSADIELPAAFTAETAEHALHPALLDLATGFRVLDQYHETALLPAGYRRLRVHRPLPSRVRSHVHNERRRRDGVELDLELRAPDGALLAEVDGYHLRVADTRKSSEGFRLEQGAAGEIASLQIASRPRTVPIADAVEIEVHAAALNFKDVLFATGLLPDAEANGWRFGLECAGRVVRTGEGVRHLVPGQPVLAYAAGSLASHLIAPAQQVLPIPLGLSFAQAATVPTGFATAIHALVTLGRLRSGETILIHAAAGGVGLAATQIALSLGAEVLATAGSEAKRASLAQLGVAATFSSRDAGFLEGVRAHTNGRGVDVVLNSLSGALMTASLDCLAPFGRFLELGVRDIHAGGHLELSRFARAISFSAVSVGPGMPGFAALFADVAERAADGRLQPLPYRIFPMAQACDAFAHMAGARHVGKVVIAVHPDAETVPAAWPARAGDAAIGSATGLATGPAAADRGERGRETAVPTTVDHQAGVAEVPAASADPEHGTTGLSVRAGVALFVHCLALGPPHVVISTVDPRTRGAGQRSAALAAAAPEPPDRSERGPAGSTEDELAAILQRLLGVSAIGPDDDFFALGGDSLIGAQFVAQASRRLGTRLTLRDLFDAPTIAGLAAQVARGAATSDRPIVPVEARRHYPLSHAQQRLWILAQNPAASVAYNMSYTLSLSGTLDAGALQRAFLWLLERHESLRTAFLIQQGTPATEIRDASHFEVPCRDLSGEDDPESAAGQEIRTQALTPIALDRPPLLRARLLRLSEQEHLLLVSLHHIVADGVSLTVLMRDLDLAYAAYAAGGVPGAPSLPIQYKDFAVWQRQQTASEAMQRDRAYWHEKLAGELPTLNLPTDRPRLATQDFGGGQIVLRLGVEPTARCRALCQRQGATLFMLLVAALQLVLHEATGDEEILLGTPVAGRDRPELQDQIGYYLNNVVLRGAVRRNASFARLLDGVRVTVADALAHQAYPFDLLLEEMTVRAVPGHAPLFDVQINLMPDETPPMRLGALDVGGFVSNSGTTIFDLNFMFSDGPHGLTLELAYSTALFDAKTVAELGQRVLRVLDEVGRDPDRSVRWLCNVIAPRADAAERDAFLAAALDLGGEF